MIHIQIVEVLVVDELKIVCRLSCSNLIHLRQEYKEVAFIRCTSIFHFAITLCNQQSITKNYALTERAIQ